MQLIDRQLNATLELTRVTELTLQHAMDAVDASSGVMGVMNEEGTGLYLLTQQGTETEYSHYQDEVWPIERGIIGQVAQTGQPIVIPHTTGKTRVLNQPLTEFSHK